jgi:DNA primase
MISETTIREVNERANCVEVVGRFVELKKAGTLFKGLCPFHDEKTPSFTVSAIRNTYHCFGCGAHGNAIKFIMEVGGRSFPEAVRELAEESGIEVEEDRTISPQRREMISKERDERKRLFEVQGLVTDYFTNQLFSQGGFPAQQYLERRGIEPASAKAFRLGYCPVNPSGLDAYAKKMGITLEELNTLGIIAPSKSGLDNHRPLGGAYVRFKDRLVCPIVDIKDQVSGFSCRLLNDNKKAAKYVNSPETPIFIKSEQLYGAGTAKKTARQLNSVIVCEGNLDVVTLWEYGFQGSVAVMGTALSDFQGLLLKRMGQQITVIMDGDSAGKKAAFAGLSSFLRAGLQPRAVLMPDGEDPDSYLRTQGTDALQARIESAKPLLEIYMDDCIAQQPNDDPGRLAGMRQIASTLCFLDDDLSRKLYVQRLEKQLGLGTELIEAALTEAKEKAAKKDRTESAPKAPVRAATKLEPVSVIHHPPLPPLQESPFTGQTSPNFESFQSTKTVPLRFPGYLSQIFGFILQFPSISLDFHQLDGHKFLTQKALIGFLGVLRQSVADGQTPNVDRILSTMTCSQTVSFLRACQVRVLTADEASVRGELPNLIMRLAVDHLKDERRRIQAALRTSFQEQDEMLCEQLQKELRDVQERLANQQRNTPEGAR